MLRPQAERARASALAAGVPLTVLEPPGTALPELYRARCALIRPDQHVAWRGDIWPDDGEALLQRVTGRSRA